MSYQFFHAETYSEQPKPVKGAPHQFNSAAQVEAEAERDPYYSEHVDMPRPPQQLSGTLTIADFRAKRAKMLAEIRETVTSKTGTTYTRALRKDAATLYTEIHSHPLTSAEYLANMDEHFPTIVNWVRRALADFKARMPEGIDYTSVLHLDEGHVHIHILAMNTPDPKLDANKLHAAKAAAAAFRETHESDVIVSLDKPELAKRPRKPKKPRPSKNRVTQKKHDEKHGKALSAWETDCAEVEAENAKLLLEWEEGNKEHLKEKRRKRGRSTVQKVYGAALIKMQDDYFEAVGKPCGLLRHGPRLARKSTKQHTAEKKQAKRMADDMAQLEAQSAEHAVIDADLVARASELAAAEADIAKREEAHAADVADAAQVLEREHAAIRRAKLADRKAREDKAAELADKEASITHREAELTEAVDAMSEIFEAVEAGEAVVENGDIFLPRWPDIIARMKGADRDDVSAPIRKLINGFVGLVLRLSKRQQDSDAPELQDDDDAPGFGG
ncbi:hypothetical protein EDD53_1306 [Pacificibacter maritimus]|uniref:Plasmid recombination enzyme n=1 Tax=Pacificibacter maritimus TaxID=762213 RepID=A0A3N4UX49_9RHOB|nr:Mob protein [Pacificibacter maritimus]RPE72161.1 hypothetical protein EDD53_1306 [Pacificibacter maritimus]